MMRQDEGPPYPKLSAAVIKWRKLANERPLSHAEKLAYGEAVEKAIRALQRKELTSPRSRRRRS